MPTTTIKVERAVRDRLASVAQARGTTMGALLDGVSRSLETEQRWAAIELAYEVMSRQDPAGWQEYLDELAQVTAGELDDDEADAEEWPEYNS